MLMMPRDHFGLSLFDDMFKDPFFKRTETPAVMKTDIKETENGYELDMDLPGFEKENIQADLDNGYLTITASKNTSNDQKDEQGNYIHRERYTGQCSRSFYVGDAVTQEDIKAGFKNGILHLEIPKKDAKAVEQKKYIAIEG